VGPDVQRESIAEPDNQELLTQRNKYMKKLIIALAAIAMTTAAFAQGTVQLNNRIPGVVDARVLLPNGSGAGAGFTAQLWGGPEGGALAPLTPTTTFRDSSAAAMGYVNAVDVSIPGVAAGGKATVELRAFNGADYGSSTIFGKSAPLNVSVGGGNLPPAALAGLNGGQPINLVPEPSTIALGILGAALLLIRRRK
jgi:hypothetical protein